MGKLALTRSDALKDVTVCWCVWIGRSVCILLLDHLYDCYFLIGIRLVFLNPSIIPVKIMS